MSVLYLKDKHATKSHSMSFAINNTFMRFLEFFGWVFSRVREIKRKLSSVPQYEN